MRKHDTAINCIPLLVKGDKMLYNKSCGAADWPLCKVLSSPSQARRGLQSPARCRIILFSVLPV